MGWTCNSKADIRGSWLNTSGLQLLASSQTGIKNRKWPETMPEGPTGESKGFLQFVFFKGTAKWTMCTTKDSGMLLANALSKRCTQRRCCIIHKRRWLQTRQRREEEEMSQPGPGERCCMRGFLTSFTLTAFTKSGLSVPSEPITEDRSNKDDENNSKT